MEVLDSIVVARPAVRYPISVRPVWIAAAFLAGCGNHVPRQRMPDDPVAHAELADVDRLVPGDRKPELQQALIAERALEAAGERVCASVAAEA